MVQVAPAELLQTIHAEWNARRAENDAMPQAPADSVIRQILSSDGDLRIARRLDSAEGTRVVMWQGLDSPELGL